MELKSILEARRVSKDQWVNTGNIYQHTFVIEPYQRGYRWEKSNVQKLLADIDQYLQSVDSNLLSYTQTYGHDETDKINIYDFYCLQALAVKPVAPETYELIDGQQRLTTVFLIYELLNAFIKGKRTQIPYTILYRRGGQNGDIFRLSEHIHNAVLFQIDDDAMDSAEAYEFGFQHRDKKWFDSYKAKLKQNIRNIPSTNTDSLTIDAYYLSEVAEAIVDFIFNYADSAQSHDRLENLYKCFQRNVLFLWYEIPENVNAKEEFASINSNKVKLTDAELIKALVLKKDKDDAQHENTKNTAHRWEAIEQGLCRPELWSFISDSDKATRIDLILDLFARQHAEESNTPYDVQSNSTNSHALFDWYETLNNNMANTAAFSGLVIKNIEKIYERICEWYDDVDIYHYIGLLTNFRAKLSHHKTQEALIQHIFALYNQSKDRDDFIEKLKSEICKCILHNVKEEDYPKTIEELADCFIYTESGQTNNLKAILWLLNAWETIEAAENNIADEKERKPVIITRLPFSHINGNLKTAKQWTLEHIMPQNPEENKDSSDDGTGKKAYQALGDEIEQDNVKVVTGDDIHRIGNMALLTHGTNSEIKNGNLAGKRNDIINMIGEGKYVPGSTVNAFSLYYNILDKDHATEDANDAKYWTIANQSSYLKRIEECLRQHGIIQDWGQNADNVQGVTANE